MIEWTSFDDEDIGNEEKPSSWSVALSILKENYATSMVLRAFAELIGRSVFVVTANGVSSQNIFFLFVSNYDQL